MIPALRIGTTAVSALVLVAMNALPIIGVAFWGWSLMMILVLYWLESGIVGVINVFKIARTAGGSEGPTIEQHGNRITVRISGFGAFGNGLAKGPIIGFFIVHYGIFWAVHGVFVFLLPLVAGLSSLRMIDPASGIGAFGIEPMDFGPLPLDALLLSTGLLAASHVVSFFANYIGRGEYLRVTPQGQMLSVYGRVVVLHFTIVAGAFVIGLFGTPLAAVVLLVAMKTALDLFFHLQEHRPVVATAA
jgi:hypothetical protein